MKKRNKTIKRKINGIVVRDFERGFWGDMGGAEIMFENMGLDPDVLPFSAVNFLETGNAEWHDIDGNVARISYKITDEKIVCTGSYLGEEQTFQMVREWEPYESKEMVCRLESEALGEWTMRTIFEKFIGPYEC